MGPLVDEGDAQLIPSFLMRLDDSPDHEDHFDDVTHGLSRAEVDSVKLFRQQEIELQTHINKCFPSERLRRMANILLPALHAWPEKTYKGPNKLYYEVHPSEGVQQDAREANDYSDYHFHYVKPYSKEFYMATRRSTEVVMNRHISVLNLPTTHGMLNGKKETCHVILKHLVALMMSTVKPADILREDCTGLAPRTSMIGKHANAPSAFTSVKMQVRWTEEKHAS